MQQEQWPQGWGEEGTLRRARPVILLASSATAGLLLPAQGNTFALSVLQGGGFSPSLLLSFPS